MRQPSLPRKLISTVPVVSILALVDIITSTAVPSSRYTTAVELRHICILVSNGYRKYHATPLAVAIKAVVVRQSCAIGTSDQAATPSESRESLTPFAASQPLRFLRRLRYASQVSCRHCGHHTHTSITLHCSGAIALERLLVGFSASASRMRLDPAGHLPVCLSYRGCSARPSAPASPRWTSFSTASCLSHSSGMVSPAHSPAMGTRTARCILLINTKVHGYFFTDSSS